MLEASGSQGHWALTDQTLVGLHFDDKAMNGRVCAKSNSFILDKAP